MPIGIEISRRQMHISSSIVRSKGNIQQPEGITRGGGQSFETKDQTVSEWERSKCAWRL